MPLQFTAQDLYDLPPCPTEWVVENTLRTNRKRISLICGSPEVGKSTLGRQLAIAVAKGIPFLGRQTFKGKVIYWQSEEDKQDAKEDFVKSGMNADDPVIVLHPEGKEDNCEELNKVLNANPDTKLVIIETLDDFLKVEDIKENTAGRQAFEKFDAEVISKHSAHCSFVALHWFKKSDTQKSMNINKILGGTIIAGKTDAKIYLHQVSDADPRRVIQLAVRKGAPIEPTYLEFNPETQSAQLGITLADERARQKKSENEQESSSLDTRIFEAIHQNPGRPKVEIKKLVRGKGEIVGKRIDEHIEAGLVIALSSARGAKLLYLTGEEPMPAQTQTHQEVACQ